MRNLRCIFVDCVPDNSAVAVEIEDDGFDVIGIGEGAEERKNFSGFFVNPAAVKGPRISPHLVGHDRIHVHKGHLGHGGVHEHLALLFPEKPEDVFFCALPLYDVCLDKGNVVRGRCRVAHPTRKRLKSRRKGRRVIFFLCPYVNRSGLTLDLDNERGHLGCTFVVSFHSNAIDLNDAIHCLKKSGVGLGEHATKDFFLRLTPTV